MPMQLNLVKCNIHPHNFIISAYQLLNLLNNILIAQSMNWWRIITVYLNIN